MDLLSRRLFGHDRLHADRALIAAGALALAFVAGAAPAAAQLAIEVSPLRVEVASNPGGAHTQAVTLSNQGTEGVRVRARVMDWFMSLDGTPQFEAALPAAEQKYGAAGWARLAPPEQVVAPGEAGTVRFTTTIPADTAPGGYRLAIMFELSPASGDPVAARRQLQFRSRVATLAYITVGEPAPAVDLINLIARDVAGQPPQIVATLRNTGPVHVRTKGVLTIYDAAGAVVREVSLPDAPVLPESDRDLAISTASGEQPPLAPGDYRVEVKLDVGLPALLVGETTLKVAG